MPPIVIAGAIAAAGAVAAAGVSASASKKAAKAQQKAAEPAALQAEISQELFEQTNPLRQATTGLLTDFAQTGTLPFALRGDLGPGAETANAQYAQARDNLLSSVPLRGGQLNNALANLEFARAGTLFQHDAALRQGLWNQAVAQSFQGVGPALQGLQGASQTQLSIAAQQQQHANAQAQAIGQLAGVASKYAGKQQPGGVVPAGPGANGPYYGGLGGGYSGIAGVGGGRLGPQFTVGY